MIQFFKLVKKNLNVTNFSLLLMFNAFLALLHSWIIQYKSPTANSDLISRVSFRVEDPPWVPGISVSHEPLLFLHYFGDWVSDRDYSVSPSPYTGEFPARLPPIGLLLLRSFSIFGLKGGYLIYLVACLLVWLFVIRKFLGNLGVTEKAIFLVFGILVTLPSIVAFDRGATYLLPWGLICLVLYYLTRDKIDFAIICSIIAFSLKLQLLPIVLILFFMYQKRQIFNLILTTLLANVFAGYLMYGSEIFSDVKGILKAILFFNSNASLGYIYDGTSVASVFARNLVNFIGMERSDIWFKSNPLIVPIIGLVWIGIVGAIVLRNQVPVKLQLGLIFSISTLSLAASQRYGMIWASAAMIMYFTDIKLDRLPKLNQTSKKYKKLSSHGSDGKTLVSQKTSEYRVPLTELLYLITLSIILMPTFKLYWNGWRPLPLFQDLYVVFMCLIALRLLIFSNKKFSIKIDS
jgi:hypothetical protein